MKKNLRQHCLSHEQKKSTLANNKRIRTVTAIYCPFFAQNGFDSLPQVTCPFYYTKSLKKVDPSKFNYFK